MAFIAIGNCSKYNIYILISLICNFLIDFLFGLNSSNKEKPVSFFSFKAKIKNHKLLDNFIRLTSIFFEGLILYFFERKHKGKKSDKICIEDNNILQDNLLKKKNDSKKFDNIIIGILFSLYLIFQDFI